jgi:hypothetical protein
MELKDLTPEAVKTAIRNFYEKTSAHVGKIVKAVGNERQSIPRTPRKMGTFQFDYFFAADLDQLARYALGGLEVARPFVLELCETIEMALFSCAAGIRVPPPAEWSDTPVGYIVRVARARAALRRQVETPLTADEVRALTGLPDDVLTAAGLLREGGDPQAAVKSFLESERLPI